MRGRKFRVGDKIVVKFGALKGDWGVIKEITKEGYFKVNMFDDEEKCFTFFRCEFKGV